MDDSSQATVRSRSTKLKGGTFDDDQCFLLYFIMGIYFGPHIKGERNQKSVLQRVAEGLPPYTYDQLTKSAMRLAEFEHIYYYALREADKSVVVKLAWLRQYFQGDISCLVHNSAARYPQFADLFPPQLHPQSLSKNRSKIIENIVFISNPETSYINPDDIERLRRLSRLEDLHLSKCPVRPHASLDSSAQYNVQEAEPNGKRPHIQSNSDSQNGDRNYFKLNLLPHPHVMTPMSGDMARLAPLPPEEDSDSTRAGPAMIFLPSPPTKKELSEIVSATKNGFALTGSAAMRQMGPIIGLMDIGECEDSYIFRVSLPGVKRDESDFSCEVDTDGKVLIRGVTTTGEKTVCRYSQVFEMETQNLCPPGHFSVSFQLPGPVDPCQFSGNFGTDGILEGVVLKGRNTN